MKLMISELLQMDQIGQNKLLKYFIKLPNTSKIEVFKIHKKTLYINRQKYVKNTLAELSYCAFLQAIKIAKNEETMLAKKSFGDLSLEEIQKLSTKRINAFKASKSRRKKVREQLVRHLPLLINLKNEQVSYRDISDFLFKKYNIKASHSLIYKILKEIK